MTYAEYAALDGTNWSTLKEIGPPKGSPLRYKHLLEHPRKDTDAFRFGRVVHCAVLEPDELERRVVCWSGDRRAGKKWAEFAHKHRDREILKASELAQALNIDRAVKSHPVAADLLAAPGPVEHVIQWTYQGIKCKARLDKITDRVIDLKTTSDISEYGFEKAAEDLKYRGQLAFYHLGAESVLGRKLKPPAVIAVEKAPPHEVVVYDYGYILDHGMDLVDRYITTLIECRSTGLWLGRAPFKMVIQERPAWALRREEEDDGGLDWGGVEEVAS
jgi:hypothetical protein